jgi:hypothetical protein
MSRRRRVSAAEIARRSQAGRSVQVTAALVLFALVMLGGVLFWYGPMLLQMVVELLAPAAAPAPPSDGPLTP